MKRTWGYVLECVTKQKQGSTKLRWLNVAKDKALASLWPKSLMQTKADDLLEALNLGTVSTNIYLRRLHNFAVDMAWIRCPIIVKRQWPSVSYGVHRAITAAEHKMILQREANAERKAFYELCWHLGGSEGDIASLRAAH